ncbi:hypothetical protein IAR50_007438 [Cryptococcus sp. DSM 104548]
MEYGRGRNQVGSSEKSVHAPLAKTTINHHTVTIYEAINAAGDTNSPQTVLPEKTHMPSANSMPDDALVSFSKTGETDDYSPLTLIKHFEEHTEKKRVGTRRLLLIEASTPM